MAEKVKRRRKHSYKREKKLNRSMAGNTLLFVLMGITRHGAV